MLGCSLSMADKSVLPVLKWLDTCSDDDLSSVRRAEVFLLGPLIPNGSWYVHSRPRRRHRWQETDRASFRCPPSPNSALPRPDCGDSLLWHRALRVRQASQACRRTSRLRDVSEDRLYSSGMFWFLRKAHNQRGRPHGGACGAWQQESGSKGGVKWEYRAYQDWPRSMGYLRSVHPRQSSIWGTGMIWSGLDFGIGCRTWRRIDLSEWPSPRHRAQRLIGIASITDLLVKIHGRQFVWYSNA